MKIVQLLPTMAYGDAVSNDALAIRKIIQSMGYRSDIYADSIRPNLGNENIIHFSQMSLGPSDVLIYHLSTGSHLNYLIEKFCCRKIMIYHNITPSGYFLGYNPLLFKYTNDGLKEVKYLKDKFDYCLADSTFNKNDLINYGYTCKIDVLPVIIPFSDYKKKPSQKVFRTYRDDCANLLFVGRVAPNKKHEDILAIFYHYHKKYNPNSRLFFVGHWHDGMDKYFHRLMGYTQALGLDNVIFTGQVRFDEILSYYKLADVFLCASEHEGFCVPLVEAMLFDIPIVAYSHAAVPETLGNGGIVLKENDPLLAAGTVNALINRPDLCTHVIKKQQERLQDFAYKKVKTQFEVYLNNFLRSIQ